MDSLGDHVALILDDGQCKFAQPSSVVRVRGNRWELLRSRRAERDDVEAAGQLHRVVRLHRQHVPQSDGGGTDAACSWRERLGIAVDQLEESGLLVMSAGIAAMSGGCASQDAVQVMSERGIGLEPAREPAAE